jgi:hypothetical protein
MLRFLLDRHFSLRAMQLNKGIIIHQMVKVKLVTQNITLATFNNVSSVVSWNFEHIVNMDRSDCLIP